MTYMDYKTTDLNLATSLTVVGVQIKEVTYEDSQRVCFHFEFTQELKKLVSDFRLDKLMLPAQSLLIKYRQLKAIVKEIKKEEMNFNHSRK